MTRAPSLLVAAALFLAATPLVAHAQADMPEVPAGYTASGLSDGNGPQATLVGPGGMDVNRALSPPRLQIQDPVGNGISGDLVVTIQLGGASPDDVLTLAQPSGASFCTVQDVASDDAGNTWVADVGHSRLLRIGPNGAVQTTPAGSTGGGSCSDSVAQGLAYAPEPVDALFIASPADGRLYRIADPGGVTLPVTPTRVAEGLGVVFGLAYDATEDRLIAVQSMLH